MKNDFITTFDSLTNGEKAAFGQYIHYFHKKEKTALNVFDYVAVHKNIEALAANSIHEKMAAFAESDPEKVASLIAAAHKNNLNALSDLKKMLIEFLTVQEIQHNSYDTQLLTLDALRKHKLHDLHEKKSKQLADALKKETSNAIEQKLMRLRLLHADYFDATEDKLKNLQGEKIQALMRELDDLFLTLKLKYSAEIESRRQILQENHPILLLDEVIDLLKKEGEKTTHSIPSLVKNLYFPLYELITDKSETAYLTLKTLVTNGTKLIPNDEQDLLMYLLNFTAYRLRQGDTRYYRGYFDLAKIGIEKNLFISNGHFSIHSFTNIVNVACRLKEYKWVEQFIHKQALRLNPEDAAVADLAQARLNFEQGCVQRISNDLSNALKYKNIHYSIQIRLLIAQANYEDKADVLLQNEHCDATEVYLSRNTMNDNLRKEVANFFTIMRFLINYKPKKQTIKSQLLKMHNLVNNPDEPVAFRDYLKQKLEALKS